MTDQEIIIDTNIIVNDHQDDDSFIKEENLLNNFSDNKLNSFKIQNSITFNENVNIKYLEKIVEHFDEIYPLIGKIKDHKKGYKVISDKKTVFTMLEKRLKHGNEFTYKTNGGRMVPDGYSCCFMNKILRHTIAGESNIDIDVDNCHPVVLSWYSKVKGWDCDNLDYYINNREEFLKTVGDDYKISRDEAKTKILSLINNENDEFNNDSSLYEFYEEIKFLQNRVCNFRKDLYRKCKNKDAHNPKGKTMSLFLQEIENKICQCMIEYCNNNNIQITAPCYDGLLISKDNFTDDLLDKIELYIYDTLDIKVSLSTKEMNKGIINKLNEYQDEESEEVYDDDFDYDSISEMTIGTKIIEQMIKDRNLLYDEYQDIIYYYDDKEKLYLKYKKENLIAHIYYYAKNYLIDIGIYYKKLDKKCDPNLVKAIIRVKNSISSTSGQRAILSQIVARLPRNHKFIQETFNQIPYLLPIRHNKVIDFRTDTIRGRQREDYFTYFVDTTYDKNVNIEEGKKLISQYLIKKDKVLDDDDYDHIECFCMTLGYFATNYNNQKNITLYHGLTDSGKSSLTNHIKPAYGDFLYQVSDNVFKQHPSSAHQSNLFGLEGRRVGFSSEMEKGQKPNEGFMKAVSGRDCDKLSARKACAPDEVKLNLNFKILVPTNHIFTSTDSAFNGRLRIFSFVNTFEKNDDFIMDYDFTSLVYKYAHFFIKNGKKIKWSKQVLHSTSSEIDNNNNAITFFKEFYTITDNDVPVKERIKREDVYKKYTQYCFDNNEKKFGKNTFYDFINNIDPRIRIYKKLHYYNVKLNDDYVEQPKNIITIVHEDIEEEEDEYEKLLNEE